MPNGFGRGFGFRGGSPPWPYTGRGRGGLPRCWYPGLYMGAPFYGEAPLAPQMTPEQELDFLRNQAQAAKEQLEQIEARMRELETKEK